MSETHPDSIDSEPQRKGRSNAILTYEKVEELALGIQAVRIGLGALNERVTKFGDDHMDHEVRLRALELAHAGLIASKGTATWAFSALWPVATVIIALASLYLSNQP